MPRENTSKYWGVSYSSSRKGDAASIRYRIAHPWACNVYTPLGRVHKMFATEREAAIHADRINLEYKLGKPLNILKPKPCE